MKLIAGLGNPGAPYQATRHNLGYCVLDYISRQYNILLKQQTAQALSCQVTLWDIPVVLVKPITFMNLSGAALAPFASYFRLEPPDIIIIHDDLDLEFGSIRVKTRGGSGGHRGIASIINALGDNTFTRIRIGIGRPPSETEEAEFVLQDFSAEEQDKLPELIMEVARCLKTILIEDPEAAMNQFHKKALKRSKETITKKD